MPASRPRRQTVSRRRDVVESARQWLARHGLRCTGPRLALLGELLLAREPLSITQLHERVAEVPCDFATVFRFVERLREQGLVRAHYWGDRQPHYELDQTDAASGEPHSHHHHLVCRDCRCVVEVSACGVEALENAICQETGFAEIGHSLEFFGLCPSCQRSKG